MEKSYHPKSGYLFLLVFGALLLLGIVSIPNQWHPAIILLSFLSAILIGIGFFYIDPNSSRVITLFGKYIGTVKDNGFFWANPFFAKKKISLRARNFESDRIKVNDKRGNPILISVITVWRVENAYKAAFEVDDYASFVKLQSDAAVRSLVGQYSYDNFDDHQTEITLRSGLQEINHSLESALAERLAIAGIQIMEARIGYLAYAEEIASAMLKRQQAEAIVAARFKIVEGAVSMVDMAIKDLSTQGIIELDPERKASMISNLMIVLCSDKEVAPVINAGTLYH